jgi:hypothetical protein
MAPARTGFGRAKSSSPGIERAKGDGLPRKANRRPIGPARSEEARDA